MEDRKTELEEVKELIKAHINEAECGVFFTPNTEGDRMVNIFRGSFFTLDICYNWAYYELFGCTDEERREIRAFYEENGGNR